MGAVAAGPHFPFRLGFLSGGPQADTALLIFVRTRGQVATRSLNISASRSLSVMNRRSLFVTDENPWAGFEALPEEGTVIPAAAG